MIRSALRHVILLALAFVPVACNEPPAVNPWRDDAITRETWTTPSEQGFLAGGREPVLRERGFSKSIAPTVDPRVPHYPLWWEDPFEDKGDMDGTFAWTWQDYVAMPYSYARYHLNTIAWPVSAIVTPPGTPMVSDGVIGRDHDAERGFSPDPTATATDFTYEDGGRIESSPTTTAPAHHVGDLLQVH